MKFAIGLAVLLCLQLLLIASVDGTSTLKACTKNAECQTPPMPCARLCALNGTVRTGPTCDAHYCLEDTACVTVPACSGLPCTKDADCAAGIVTCALCVDNKFPACKTSTCAAGYCHSVPLCSLTRPKPTPKPKLLTTKCNKDKDCKVSHAGCTTCPKQRFPGEALNRKGGPKCDRAYCYQNACVLQPKCGGKPCKKDSDCPVRSLACARCKDGQFPSCATNKCSAGFCHSIPLCSLKK